MKVSVTFDSGHPNKLPEMDGAVAFVWRDDTPLRGLAARADWRLNGFLSRLMQQERFQGDEKDWLLVPTQGRLPFSLLFLVGMGQRTDHDEARAVEALHRIASKLGLAGVHSVCIDLGEIAVPSLPPEKAMMVFLGAVGTAYPRDEFADPVYRPAVEAAQRNEARALASRKRRQELAEARRRWENEGGGEADPASIPPGAGARPVAGQIAPEPGPPDPSSVPEPEVEARPERTVQIVLLGVPRAVSSMRKTLKEGPKQAGRLEVEWTD